MITADDVRAAAKVLDGVAHRTPVVTSRTLDELVGAPVALKPECLQRGGAFKFRGAFNKIQSLPAGRDVLAYSSGNHAQAVALAASITGRRATILMPEDAPRSKLDATRGYGAELVIYDRYREDREALGDVLVVPVGGGGLISGCATIAKELGVARVVGVEPEAGDDVRRSLAAGERVRIDVPRTIADGLQTTAPGALTFPVIRQLVDEIVT